MTCLLEDIQGSLFFCSDAAVLLPFLIQHLLHEVPFILIQWPILPCRLHKGLHRDGLLLQTACSQVSTELGLVLHRALQQHVTSCLIV